MIRRASRRQRRAVATLYFVLIGLPFLFFGGGLAVDFTRYVVGARQVSNAAEAAAQAGALQFRDFEIAIDESQGRAMALEAFNHSVAAGQTRIAIINDVYSEVDYSGTTVSVTVTYQIPTLGFLNLFLPGAGAESLVVFRQAELCLADQTVYTSGYCARPSE